MSHQIWTTCRKYNVTPNQAFFLDCCRYKIKAGPLINDEAEAFIARSRGFLNEQNVLTQDAMNILEELETLTVKTKKKVATEVLGDQYLKNIDTYREFFPPIRLKSTKLARQSVKELKDRFVWFFKTYPEYSWDLVLDAAKYYCILMERESYNYMICSSYFIQKTDNFSKSSKSELADYCQLILDNPHVLEQV